MSLGLSVGFQHFPWLRPTMTLVAARLLLWFASRYFRAARAHLRAAPLINAAVALFFVGFAVRLAVGQIG